MEWNNKIKKIISSSKLYHLRLNEQINDSLVSHLFFTEEKMQLKNLLK